MSSHICSQLCWKRGRNKDEKARKEKKIKGRKIMLIPPCSAAATAIANVAPRSVWLFGSAPRVVKMKVHFKDSMFGVQR